MKALVTGCAGLIGSSIVERCLDRGWNVVGIDNLSRGTMENMKEFKDNDNFNFFHFHLGLIDVIPGVGQMSFDAVFHMGALVQTKNFYENVEETFKVNVLEAYDLMNWSKKHCTGKFINGSSSEIYGHPQIFPTGEYNDVHFDGRYKTNRWSYALGKLLMEYIYPTAIHMRFGNVYGERDTEEEHVIPKFIKRILRGDELEIDLNEKTTRSFVYAEDCADACIMAYDKGVSGESYNIGGYEEITMFALAKKIGKFANKEVVIGKPFVRDGNPIRRNLDTSKALEHFGWRQKIYLDEGLKRMIEYIKKEMDK